VNIVIINGIIVAKLLLIIAIVVDRGKKVCLKFLK